MLAQNLTGFPAISVPAGYHASGVTFGLQLTGLPYHEDLLLGMPEMWETAHPWPSTPPDYPAFTS